MCPPSVTYDALLRSGTEFGDITVTDLDAKHRDDAKLETVLHVEPADAIDPAINPLAESSDAASEAGSDAHGASLSPGRLSSMPRAPAPLSREQSDLSNLYQSNALALDGPFAATDAPVKTPSTQDAPLLETHFQMQTARYGPGMPFCKDSSNTSLCECPYGCVILCHPYLSARLTMHQATGLHTRLRERTRH